MQKKNAPFYRPSRIIEYDHLLKENDSLPNKPCLVLDLDETLVHCETTKFSEKHDFQFNFKTVHVYGKFRPHAKEFLKEVAKWYEIIIFTGLLYFWLHFCTCQSIF